MEEVTLGVRNQELGQGVGAGIEFQIVAMGVWEDRLFQGT